MAESMPSPSSALGISRNCNSEHFGCGRKRACFVHHERDPSTRDWLRGGPRTMMLLRIPRPSSCSTLDKLFPIRNRSFDQNQDLSLWKWTPASGWLRARCSRAGHVFLSHSAAGDPRIDTLYGLQRVLLRSRCLIRLTAYNLHLPKAKHILCHNHQAYAWLPL